MNYDTPATGASVAGALIGGLIGLVVAVFYIAVMWRVFSKAGRPGWAAIIPIYNLYTLVKVAGRSGWWVLLYIIPIVNIIVSIIVSIDVARSFGKGTGFGVVGLWLFSFIGYPILAFGGARYVGPAAAGPGQHPAAAY